MGYLVSNDNYWIQSTGAGASSTALAPVITIDTANQGNRVIAFQISATTANLKAALYGSVDNVTFVVVPVVDMNNATIAGSGSFTVTSGSTLIITTPVQPAPCRYYQLSVGNATSGTPANYTVTGFVK